MWNLGNSWTDAQNTPIASYNTVMHEIHVLLVDHDPEALINTTKLLEICQYRVTFVELASAAITMLSSGKVKFDIVMANINSPDLHGFKLLQHAASMNILVILMSIDENPFMTTRALENGAFMYIKKPVALDMLRTLWQHVLREKTRYMRERDRLVATNYPMRGVEFREPIQQLMEEQSPNYNIGGNDMAMMTMMEKGKGKKKIRGRKGANEDEEQGLQNHMMINNNKVKKKACTEWTQELHVKFMNAVEELGEGRCFPKEILELMDVPGLTRMQVASHLQKCRNDNWRSPEDRKSHHNHVLQPAFLDIDMSQQKPRRFGSMPQIGRTSSQEASGSRQGSQTRSDTEAQNGGSSCHGNLEAGSDMPNQNYASLLVGTSNDRHGKNYSSPIPRGSDEFFNFSDMDSMMQNMSGLPQGSRMNNLNEGHGGYFFNPIYHHEQNSAVRSMDTRSHWSSETSNIGSDQSEGPNGRE